MINWLQCSGIRKEERYDFINGKICGRKLLAYEVDSGHTFLQVKCPRCSAVNEVDVYHDLPLINSETETRVRTIISG